MANSLEKFFLSKVKGMPMVEFVMTPESLRKPSSSKKTVPVKGKLKPPGPPEVSTPPKTSSKPPSSEQLQNNIKKPDLGRDSVTGNR